jgi:hypothetical protein
MDVRYYSCNEHFVKFFFVVLKYADALFRCSVKKIVKWTICILLSWNDLPCFYEYEMYFKGISNAILRNQNSGTASEKLEPSDAIHPCSTFSTPIKD